MGEARALQLRLTAGLLASAARLVPIPFLDDLLREKALQLLVSRTLLAHDRTYGSKRVASLYGDPHGCLHGCLLAVVLLPIKLLIYPFRKVLIWILAAKYLAKDLCEAVLLGRVLEKCLAEGRLAEGTEPASLASEADRVRQAFDNAITGTDLRLLRGVLRQAVRSVAGLPRAAWHGLRSLRRRGGEDADPAADLSAADRAKVEAGTERIRAALETPEARAYLERFDATFRENLAVLEQRAGSRPGS